MKELVLSCNLKWYENYSNWSQFGTAMIKNRLQDIFMDDSTVMENLLLQSKTMHHHVNYCRKLHSTLPSSNFHNVGK